MGKIGTVGLVLTLSSTVLIALLYVSSFTHQSETLLLSQMLSSFRSDLAHPYNSMHPVDNKFVNPYNMREPAINPKPLYPYNNGKRPKAVLHREFEHNPYGNKLLWESGPAGALAKDIKRPDRFWRTIVIIAKLSRWFHQWHRVSRFQAPRISLRCESRWGSEEVDLRYSQIWVAARTDYAGNDRAVLTATEAASEPAASRTGVDWSAEPRDSIILPVYLAGRRLPWHCHRFSNRAGVGCARYLMSIFLMQAAIPAVL